MSNQRSEKARSSPTQTWIALATLLATYNFAASHFFTVQTVFKTILDTSFQVLCRWHWCRGLMQNRPNHTVCRNNFGSYLCNLESGIGANCKTSVFSKTSKRTSGWWLASNFRIIPLAKKYQIDNQRSRASPTQTWIALRTLLATYNFAASPSCTAQTRST